MGEYPGWGMDGAQLHHPETGVPPDRWCVSKADFAFLRKQIEHELKEGRMQPTERDPFEISERKIGPNMYTIVDAYVKPLTRDAGSMSWALLRHPTGLKCGFFITHGWAEGLFEFVDKVLGNWPAYAGGAWCCVFANPQNLDISALISDPLSSSFAVALRSCSTVMVVPNKRVSIYTRIWCVYEAHLAVEQGSVVFTAAAPVGKAFRHFVLIALALMVPSGVVGAFIPFHWVGVDIFFFVAVGSVVASHFWARSRRVNQVVNIIGVCIAAITQGMRFNLQPQDPPQAVFDMFLSLFSYFTANEYDRLMLSRQFRDAEQLQCGFAGVAQAQASVQADKDQIMGQIGHTVPYVDDSINVLICTGMSTPTLRSLAAHGFDMRRARDFRYSLAAFAIQSWVGVGLVSVGIHGLASLFFWSGALACLWLVIQADMDERAFIMSAIGKLQVFDSVWRIIFYVGCRCAPDVVHLASWIYAMQHLECVLVYMAVWLAVLLAMTGRRQVAHVPCVGLFLAHGRQMSAEDWAGPGDLELQQTDATGGRTEALASAHVPRESALG